MIPICRVFLAVLTLTHVYAPKNFHFHYFWRNSDQLHPEPRNTGHHRIRWLATLTLANNHHLEIISTFSVFLAVLTLTHIGSSLKLPFSSFFGEVAIKYTQNQGIRDAIVYDGWLHL